jgi:hypothetical protein
MLTESAIKRLVGQEEVASPHRLLRAEAAMVTGASQMMGAGLSPAEVPHSASQRPEQRISLRGGQTSGPGRRDRGRQRRPRLFA